MGAALQPRQQVAIDRPNPGSGYERKGGTLGYKQFRKPGGLPGYLCSQVDGVFHDAGVRRRPGLKGRIDESCWEPVVAGMWSSRGGVKEALFRFAWQSKGYVEMEF